MIVVCEKCHTRFKLPDEKVPPGGVKVRCSKCKHSFRVYRPGEEPDLKPDLESSRNAEASQPQLQGEDEISKQIDELLGSLNLDDVPSADQEIGAQQGESSDFLSFDSGGSNSSLEQSSELEDFESFADEIFTTSGEPENTEEVPSHASQNDFSGDVLPDSEPVTSEDFSLDFGSENEDTATPSESGNVEEFISNDFQVETANEEHQPDEGFISSDFSIDEAAIQESPSDEAFSLSGNEVPDSNEITSDTFAGDTSEANLDLELDHNFLQDLVSDEAPSDVVQESTEVIDETGVLDISATTEKAKKQLTELSLIEKVRQKRSLLRERKKGITSFLLIAVVALVGLFALGGWKSGETFTSAIVYFINQSDNAESMKITSPSVYSAFIPETMSRVLIVEASLKSKKLTQPVKVEAVDKHGRVVESHVVYPQTKLDIVELASRNIFEAESILSLPSDAKGVGGEKKIYAIFSHIKSDDGITFRFLQTE